MGGVSSSLGWPDSWGKFCLRSCSVHVLGYGAAMSSSVPREGSLSLNVWRDSSTQRLAYTLNTYCISRGRNVFSFKCDIGHSWVLWNLSVLSEYHETMSWIIMIIKKGFLPFLLNNMYCPLSMFICFTCVRVHKYILSNLCYLTLLISPSSFDGGVEMPENKISSFKKQNMRTHPSITIVTT